MFFSLLNADSYGSFLYFWCPRVSIYVTNEMPSNDKPLLKDLEWLLDSKLKPIHTRNEFDERFKCLISSLFKKRINFAFH